MKIEKHITSRRGFAARFALCAALLLLCSAPQPTAKAQNEYYVFNDGTTPSLNRVPKWKSVTNSYFKIGDSLISDDGTNVTLNGASAMRLIFPDFSLATSSGLGGSAEFKNVANSAYCKVRMGGFLGTRTDSSLYADIGQSGEMLALASSAYVAFSSTVNSNASKDTGFARCAAGVVCATTGSGTTATGALQATGTSQPTCNSTTRGAMWTVQSTSGVGDIFQVCMKGTADTYAWRSVFTAP